MGDTKWLSEDEMAAWQAFLAAGALLDRRIEEQLKADAGLSHVQYEVLVRLSAAEGGELRMSELAADVLTTKSGLTYQITQMEKAGLVRRRSCPGDVRGVYAVLTGAGRARLEEAAPGHLRVVRAHLFDVLSEGQVRAMREGLQEVVRVLGGA
ncbi:MarR family winged helix-turn-helix transcriptional regulator [Streptomyces flavofungini]|uniref:MarR family winged helix-turn-helix transcriptional regulator n=1 Tax=Streptomyces flavofungini TaxID=68200 RepID=UPI0025AF4368|nr:MarR family transcriptional regulator [Streptomyces flavofungini]WJV50357.1 MarR family transcriptional regulator [Streptomyces flavofungini]